MKREPNFAAIPRHSRLTQEQKAAKEAASEAFLDDHPEKRLENQTQPIASAPPKFKGKFSSSMSKSRERSIRQRMADEVAATKKPGKTKKFKADQVVEKLLENKVIYIGDVDINIIYFRKILTDMRDKGHSIEPIKQERKTIGYKLQA